MRSPVFDATIMLLVYDLGEKPAPFLRFAAILPENDPLVSFKTQSIPLTYCQEL